jgi:hypothetical protein
LRKLYNSYYRNDKPADKQNNDNDDYFEAYLKKVLPGVVKDEYKEYSEGQRMVRPPTNLYQWWNAQNHIPSMRQMAFDHISIPAISAETERVFSNTKLFISDLRSRLRPEIIEALECISPVIGKCNHFVLAHQITSPEPLIRRNTSRHHDLKL